MNEMNSLETQLRSWAPRRPAARLKARIFASPATSKTARHCHWLTPALACCLLCLLAIGRLSNPWEADSSAQAPMVAMILSNQSYAAYLPGSFEHQHNSFRADTFEWTNGSRSTSSMGSLSPMKGND